MSVSRLNARVRRRIGRGAWRLAMGSVSGAVPDRYVRSIVEQASRPAIAERLEDASLLAPAHVEYYDVDDALGPEYRRSKAFDDRFVYRLRNICVSPGTGLCWLPGGPLLEESYGSLIRLLGWGRSALDEPLVGARVKIEGTVVVLPGDGYFHWLLEALPAALHALEQEPGATLLVPRTAPRYLDEALELLGHRNIRRTDEPVLAERLVLAARDPFSGFVPSEDVAVLRRTLLPRVGSGSQAAIYVSRRLDTRRPANEQKVERALGKLGVQAVTSQALTLPEQIEMFAGACGVVAPHGAGLANLVWSTHLDGVWEIFLSGHFNDCYARLAAILGARYRPVQCSNTPEPWGSVPVDELQRSVQTGMPVLEPTGGRS